MSAAPRLNTVDAATELLARILLAEAGFRPARAVEALAALAMNRAAAIRTCPEARLRFSNGMEAQNPPRALLAVLRSPFQFAVRHPHHPRHAAFAAPRADDPALAMCRRIAHRALAGALPDATGGCVLWHEDTRQPHWALGLVPAVEIGGLCFFRLG